MRNMRKWGLPNSICIFLGLCSVGSKGGRLAGDQLPSKALPGLVQKSRHFYSQALAPNQDGICSESEAQHTLIGLWPRGTFSLSIEFFFFFFFNWIFFLKSNSCVYWFSALDLAPRILLKRWNYSENQIWRPFPRQDLSRRGWWHDKEKLAQCLLLPLSVLLLCAWHQPFLSP